MATVKYTVKEFTPTSNQVGAGMGHSWSAKSVINNTISPQELVKKVAARTGTKSYEALAVISALLEITMEELLESNAVVLGDGFTNLVTLSPSCSGGVSDKQIEKETTAAHEKDSSVPVRTTSTEADVTPGRLSWTINARVGANFIKDFITNKKASKVKSGNTMVSTDDDSGDGNVNV